MMTEVRSINALRADRENNNSLLSPIECLEDAAEDLRAGIKTPDKLLVLGLDTKEDGYRLSFWACNLRSSEIVALCEAMKMRVIRDMDLI